VLVVKPQEKSVWGSCGCIRQESIKMGLEGMGHDIVDRINLWTGTAGALL
jgi:hypothetical protein